jgi:hypothetical protein
LCWLDVLVSMILEIFLEKKKYETDCNRFASL